MSYAESQRYYNPNTQQVELVQGINGAPFATPAPMPPMVNAQSAGALNADLIPATDVSAYAGAYLLVTGTFSGTLTVQGCNDNVGYQSVLYTSASVLSSASATITTTGFYYIPFNFKYLRVRMTAYTSGSATGNITYTYVTPSQVYQTVTGTINANLLANGGYFSESTTNLGVSGLFTGSSHDAGATQGYTRLRLIVGHVAGNTPGHIYIQQSTDNATWKETHRVPIPSDANFRHLEFPWTLRYIRVLFQNGATAQTAMYIQSLGVRCDGGFDYDKTLSFLETTTALAANGVYTGNTYNLGANFSFNKVRCMVSADQAGTLTIQQSRNGSTWVTTVTQAVAANTPLIVEGLIATQYVRVVYTNGATLQGNFELETALIRQ